MNSSSHPSSAPGPGSFTASVMVIAIVMVTFSVAAAVLVLGWAMDIDVARRLAPGLATMKVNTAIGFALTAVALLMLAPGWRRPRAAIVIASVVGLLGLATLAQDLFSVSLGIDQLLVRDLDTDPAVAAPGRMSPATSACFIVIALALIGSASGRSARVLAGQIAAIVVTVISFVALTGYLYGVTSLYHVLPFSSMALHTATLFLLLAVGVLAARPDGGVTGLFTDRSLGGVLARELLPAIVVACVTLGLLRVWGERGGLYDSPFGTAAYTVIQIMMIAALIVGYAKIIGHADRKRADALAREQVAHQRLEVILGAIGDAVIATGPDGFITYFNAGAARLTGYDPEQAMGQPVTAIFQIVDRQTESPLPSPVLRVAGRRPDEVREDGMLISRNGDRIRIADTISPIRTEGGKAAGVAIVFRCAEPPQAVDRHTHAGDSGHASAG